MGRRCTTPLRALAVGSATLVAILCAPAAHAAPTTEPVPWEEATPETTPEVTPSPDFLGSPEERPRVDEIPLPGETPPTAPSPDATDTPEPVLPDGPTGEPTDEPTKTPTDEPTPRPTVDPTQDPTDEPTSTPTTAPSQEPTAGAPDRSPAPTPTTARPPAGTTPGEKDAARGPSGTPSRSDLGAVFRAAPSTPGRSHVSPFSEAAQATAQARSWVLGDWAPGSGHFDGRAAPTEQAEPASGADDDVVVVRPEAAPPLTASGTSTQASDARPLEAAGWNVLVPTVAFSGAAGCAVGGGMFVLSARRSRDDAHRRA